MYLVDFRRLQRGRERICRRYLRRACSAVALLVVAGALSAANTAAATIELMAPGTQSNQYYEGISPDGRSLFFISGEDLTPDSSNSSSGDLFASRNGLTTLIAPGDADHAPSFGGAIADGSHAYFHTQPEIAPNSFTQALKEWTASQVSTFGSGTRWTSFGCASPDGASAVFSSEEQLVAADQDKQWDVYRRQGQTLTQLTPGPAEADGAHGSYFRDASADCSRIVLLTAEAYTPQDTDGGYGDVYQLGPGGMQLVSTGPTGGAAGFNAAYVGTSRDGSHVFFKTDEALVSDDEDASEDLYQWSAAGTELVAVPEAGGDAAADVELQASSSDGAHIFFTTAQSLVASDLNGALDVYERFDGNTFLRSIGDSGAPAPQGAYFGGASADGSTIVFATRDPLDPVDQDDSSFDLYARSSGRTHLVTPSTPESGLGGITRAVRADGNGVIFTSARRLTPQDQDTREDFYQWSPGGLQLLSLGPTGGNGDFVLVFRDVNADVTRLVFDTAEQLTSDDDDNAYDHYAVDLPDPLPQSSAATQPTTPGLQPVDGPMPPGPLSTESDERAPRLRLIGWRHALTLSRFVRLGLPLTISSDEAARLRVELVLVSSSSRTRPRTRILAAAGRRLARAGRVRLILRPTRTVGLRLRQTRRIRTNVVITATDLHGNRRTLRRPLLMAR